MKNGRVKTVLNTLGGTLIGVCAVVMSGNAMLDEGTKLDLAITFQLYADPRSASSVLIRSVQEYEKQRQDGTRHNKDSFINLDPYSFTA